MTSSQENKTVRNRTFVCCCSVFLNICFTDCLETRGSAVTKSQLMCWFTGVYPNGTVHWFHGDLNITEQANTTQVVNSHGGFNVLSTLNMQKGNEGRPYNCSLWIPSERKYLSTEQLTSAGSRSSTDGLQWVSAAAVVLCFLHFI